MYTYILAYIYACVCPIASLQVCGFFGTRKAGVHGITTAILQTFPASVVTAGLISENSYRCPVAKICTGISWIKEVVLSFRCPCSYVYI